MIFNDRRANKRALKAAQGPSLAPKGYKPDTEGRGIVHIAAGGGTNLSDGINLKGSRKKRYTSAAQLHSEPGTVDYVMKQYKKTKLPKNILPTREELLKALEQEGK